MQCVSVLNNFLVFETNKSERELIEHLKGLNINIISGVSIAVGAVIGFGLIFTLGDLLKNTVEINQKLNK